MGCGFAKPLPNLSLSPFAFCRCGSHVASSATFLLSLVRIPLFSAGDHVKFGFPFAYSMTVLAWGGVAYPNAYNATGQTNNLLDEVKWGTNYIRKAHVASNILYGQVETLLRWSVMLSY